MGSVVGSTPTKIHLCFATSTAAAKIADYARMVNPSSTHPTAVKIQIPATCDRKQHRTPQPTASNGLQSVEAQARASRSCLECFERSLPQPFCRPFFVGVICRACLHFAHTRTSERTVCIMKQHQAPLQQHNTLFNTNVRNETTNYDQKKVGSHAVRKGATSGSIPPPNKCENDT